jgi:hypothetical protein
MDFSEAAILEAEVDGTKVEFSRLKVGAEPVENEGPNSGAGGPCSLLVLFTFVVEDEDFQKGAPVIHAVLSLLGFGSLSRSVDPEVTSIALPLCCSLGDSDPVACVYRN